jgi:hypothetical protein
MAPPDWIEDCRATENQRVNRGDDLACQVTDQGPDTVRRGREDVEQLPVDAAAGRVRKKRAAVAKLALLAPGWSRPWQVLW